MFESRPCKHDKRFFSFSPHPLQGLTYNKLEWTGKFGFIMVILILMNYAATSSCLALLQRSRACAAHNYLVLATRVLNFSHYSRASHCPLVGSSPQLFWERSFYAPQCYSGSQRMVCHFVLHICSLCYLIFHPADSCGFTCQVFAVAGTFQEGVLVSILRLFYSMIEGQA